MDTKSFLTQLDHQRITEAIRLAETGTSGEIRVFVSRSPVDDPVGSAKREFLKLKMDRTQQRNAVLVYVAPTSQSFAVVGDQGVHEKCGQNFWGQVAEAMRAHFKEGRFTEGIVHGIAEAGKALSIYFPRQADDENELPDQVVEG